MLVLWDERKRASNLVKHGLDFMDFEAGFDFETANVGPAKMSAAGAARFKLIGMFEERLIVVAIVSALGSEAISLISMRPASRVERSLYEEA